MYLNLGYMKGTLPKMLTS